MINLLDRDNGTFFTTEEDPPMYALVLIAYTVWYAQPGVVTPPQTTRVGLFATKKQCTDAISNDLNIATDYKEGPFKGPPTNDALRWSLLCVSAGTLQQ
jgi:hypothetical protein